MLCGNSYALDNYMLEIEKKEEMFDMFLSDCEDDINKISEIFVRLQNKAERYNCEYGYNFDEDLRELINEIL